MRTKVIIAMLAVLVLAGGAYFAFSKYLVSRLDGTGGVTAAPGSNIETYAPGGFGLSFAYPADRYDTRMNTEGGSQTLTLMPEAYVPPPGGEGPPVIAIASYSNAEGLPLEQFVKNEPRTNFSLSSDQSLVPVTVGGLPALAYRHSGLYETDAVAVAAGGKVYILSAGWTNESDAIRADFKNLLQTVQFNY